MTTVGEPKLGKRGPHPSISTPNGALVVRHMMNVLAYCDGTQNLIGLSNYVGVEGIACRDMIRWLAEHDLLALAPAT